VTHRFGASVAAIAAAGLAIRLGYVLVAKRDEPLSGDALAFFIQGHAVADGHGFANPGLLAFRNVVQPAADHPPLFTLYLALFDVLGVTTPLGQRLAMVPLGVATIVVVGFVGRRVAGERVGLVAAGLAAVSPTLWVNDAQVLSESLAILSVALVVWTALTLWSRPGWTAAAVFGAACGVAALVRSETLLLAPAIGVPLIITMRDARARDRVALLATVAVAAVAVMAPWIVRNATALERPVPLGTGVDITLANSNCASTYTGPLLGWWDIRCGTGPDVHADQSVQAKAERRRALEFVGDHLDRVPVVVAARVGRVWGLFRPRQTVTLMVDEGRERSVGYAALAATYALGVLAAAGAVQLRRARAVPLTPLVAPIVMATLSAALAFGNPRYRSSAEVALVVLAAVAVAGLRLGPARRQPLCDRPRPEPPPLEAVAGRPE